MKMPSGDLLGNVLSAFAFLMVFVVPTFARNWLQLALIFLSGYVLVMVSAHFLIVPGTEVFILVFTFILLLGTAGLLARAISLIAKHFAHKRPASLWIEFSIAAALIISLMVEAPFIKDIERAIASVMWEVLHLLD